MVCYAKPGKHPILVSRGLAVFDTRILPSSKTTPLPVTPSCEAFDRLPSPARFAKSDDSAVELWLLE